MCCASVISQGTAVLELFHSLLRELDFPWRGFVRLLHEAAQDNDLLSFFRAVQASAPAVLALCTNFPDFTFQVFNVGLMNVGQAKLFDHFGNSHHLGLNVHRERIKFRLGPIIQEFYRPSAALNLTAGATPF